ncbi:MAG: ACP S-malonyltransferase [Desulfovibrio sp.]|nr:ACP S-malonyltransferase [Desulfovibrio sp.]
MMKTAVLFPGQGAQEAGMGRLCAENDGEIMELWKKAERISGLPLRAIYWDGDGAETAKTINVQPALTVFNLALWMKASGRFHPEATAGHSLGEYSALAAAGVLSFESVLKLVSLRGRLMHEADSEGKGTMAAVLRLDLSQVERCVAEAAQASAETLVIAHNKTPTHFVASGTHAAIGVLQEKIREHRGRLLPLSVSGAFHSPLMSEAALEFAKALDGLPKTSWSVARFPVYCNADPRPATDPGRIRELLKKQILSPVYWIDTIRRQWADGCTTFVELSPKEILGKMVGAVLAEVAPAPDAAGVSPWKNIFIKNSSMI